MIFLNPSIFLSSFPIQGFPCTSSFSFFQLFNFTFIFSSKNLWPTRGQCHPGRCGSIDIQEDTCGCGSGVEKQAGSYQREGKHTGAEDIVLYIDVPALSQSDDGDILWQV